MRASYHLKPVMLELGGKNYAVVLEDADLGAAADMILEGALLNVSRFLMTPQVLLMLT
jgi:acyl-CoA reductase-like NAD-dependent aldehyde dehydrogenase